jgi:hypothetical protein
MQYKCANNSWHSNQPQALRGKEREFYSNAETERMIWKALPGKRKTCQGTQTAQGDP